MGGSAWMTLATRGWRIERSQPGKFTDVRRGPVANAVRQDESEAAPSLLEGRLRMRPVTGRR